MGLFSPTVETKPMAMTQSKGLTDLYRRHSEMVYRTALRMTGNSADAEDVLQTVFLRVLSPGNRIGPMAVPGAYLHRAATNASLDILRRRFRRSEMQLHDAWPHAARESPALLKEQLRRAIAALDQGDAEMFVLRYVEGLSNGELGELFGIRAENVAVRLHRIRQALQEEMGR